MKYTDKEATQTIEASREFKTEEAVEGERGGNIMTRVDIISFYIEVNGKTVIYRELRANWYFH